MNSYITIVESTVFVPSDTNDIPVGIQFLFGLLLFDQIIVQAAPKQYCFRLMFLFISYTFMIIVQHMNCY